MTFHVGFTGPWRGMPTKQLQAVYAEFCRISESKLINHHHDIVLHHGDCVGADADSHTLARLLGWQVHKHPAWSMGNKAAHCEPYDECDEPIQTLVRNRVIARSSSMLVGASRLDHEELRSGEWATIRYAEADGVPVVVFAPDGRRIKR